MATPELPAPLTFPMNAESYLRKQGWKGSGHSLDSTGRGIKKPLLIAHKQDQLGLGKKKAAWTTDDQWWMRAYDQSLQNIGTGEEVLGTATDTGIIRVED
jgi:nucleolar protein TMA23